MTDDAAIIPVLQRYAIEARSMEVLGAAGGLSGAQFWRVMTARRMLCLRRWPREHPSQERLRSIHAVLQHAQRNGFERLPVPLSTLDGDTMVRHRGALFELTPWLPGRADFCDNPSQPRLHAAMTSLAEFHRAVASFSRFESPLGDAAESGVSPGVTGRLDQLQRLIDGDVARLAAAVDRQAHGEMLDVGRRLLLAFQAADRTVLRELSDAANWQVGLQPCIRDVWHDHILFTGNEVTGIVDFGALRRDHVACDIARLMGSLVADDSDAWQTALAAYHTVRPLSEVDRSLVAIFDRSMVLLSGMNWLHWLYVEQRRFDEPQRVQQRLRTILERLERLARPRGAARRVGRM